MKRPNRILVTLGALGLAIIIARVGAQQQLGTVIPPPRPTPAFSMTASVVVTGTTSETSLVGAGVGSATLPANWFQSVGDILHVRWEGYENPGNSGTCITFRPKLAGTALSATCSNASAVSGNYPCFGDVIFAARAVGSSGSVLGNGGIFCMSGAAGNLDWFPIQMINTPVTVNTTVALAFDFTVQLGASAQTVGSTNLVLSKF